jgi:hypothetical protein
MKLIDITRQACPDGRLVKPWETNEEGERRVEPSCILEHIKDEVQSLYINLICLQILLTYCKRCEGIITNIYLYYIHINIYV